MTLLVVSANMTDEIAQEARDAGANRCMQKPIDQREMLAMVGVKAQAVTASG